jgi:hypothetical protein
MTRWARFRSSDGRTGFGIFEETHILEYEGDFFAGARPTGRTLMRERFTLESPCTPSKIVALWNNFHALKLKLGKPAPTHPLFLLKDVPLSEATAHIFGYTCVNDVTASGVLNENVDFAQWCRSKGYDTFGCLGPVIATGLEWSRLRVITRVDGEERQNYPLSDMIMPPEELVSRISHDMSLLPGDVIACGTSVGVGSIKDGCAVEIDIGGIGSLVNVLSPSAP